MSKKRESRRYGEEFQLNSHERATFGATITARSMESGKTRTFARTNETAIDAVRLVVDELDALPGDFRVVAISTPVTIRRDIFANRIALNGDVAGSVSSGVLPESFYLAKIKRLDRMHPACHTNGQAEYAGPKAAA